MKKLFLIILILTSLNVKSQSFKLSVGASSSMLSFDRAVPLFNVPTMGRNYDYKNLKTIGPSFTFGIEYAEKKYFNLSTNIGYLNKGGISSIVFLDSLGKPTGIKSNTKWNLAYFTFNTTVDFHYPISKSFLPFVSFGPRFDFLSSPKRFYKLPSDNNKYAFGVNIGLGFKFKMKNYSIGLKYDYLPNFTEILEYSTYNSPIPNESVIVKDKTSQINIFFTGKIRKRKSEK